MTHPCILLPWLTPAICPDHDLLNVYLLDLHLPTPMLRAEIPLYSASSPPLPLDAEAVQAYLLQVQAVIEDSQALSANLFTHIDHNTPMMSRAEQTTLEAFANERTSGTDAPTSAKPALTAAHMGLLCAALSQNQQAEMAALIQKYHASLKQFSTSIHGEEHAETDYNHPLHHEKAFFDITSDPMNWRYILERMALFVPQDTIFVFDSTVLADLPKDLLQPLSSELYERLPKMWSQSIRSQLTGMYCSLRHVLGTATKSACSDTVLDQQYLFVTYPLIEG